MKKTRQQEPGSSMVVNVLVNVQTSDLLLLRPVRCGTRQFERTTAASLKAQHHACSATHMEVCTHRDLQNFGFGTLVPAPSCQP
jgi:hypothetical protein